MKRKRTKYHDYLIESLGDPEDALAYLNEAVTDEDPRILLLALKNVYEAQGGSMKELAEEANLGRVNLYRMLSKKGNPRLTNIRSVLNAMGLNLAILPRK